MTPSSAFAVGPLIVPDLNVVNAALLLVGGLNIFSYKGESSGQNMGYSRFAKPGATIPSRLGMFLFYLPALIASAVGVAMNLPADIAAGSLIMEPGTFLAAMLESRPLLVAVLLFVHFLKRDMEVLFMQKFSGFVEASTLVAIPVYYMICAAACIHFAQEVPAGLLASTGASSEAVAFGCTMFAVGQLGNLYHHWLLASLRSSSDSSGAKVYKVPQGGLFSLVTCPHYFFEIIGMFGIAVASQNLFPFVMASGMTGYLAGRSQAHRQWYLKNMDDFPRERKALIPYLF